MECCPVLKIALLGDPDVGKTTLLKKFMRAKLDAEITDVQVKYIERNGQKVKLQIRDTAGLERHRSLTQSYYKGIVSFIFVYDVNNVDTFDNLTRWNEQYTQNCNDPVNSHILVVGNKRQLADTNRVTAERARNFAKHIDADFIEISTRNDVNIDECFFRVADNFFKTHSRHEPPLFSTSTIILNDKPKRIRCCITT